MTSSDDPASTLDRVLTLERVRRGSTWRKLLSLSPRRTAILAAHVRMGRTTTRPWRAKTVFGAPMLLTPPDPPSMWIGRYGYFEPSVMALLNGAIGQGDTVVDVGAHVGFFTLWSAVLAGHTGGVVALEATPRTAALLRRNVEGACAPVTVVGCAAYDHAGILLFNDLGPGAAGYNGPADANSAGEQIAHTKPTILSVPCLPLDALLSDHERVDCIKIDAEGSELAVLSGARATLERHRPHVVMETGDFSSPGRTRAAIDAVLDLGGYVVHEPTETLKLRLHNLTEVYGYGNLLLSPEERTGSLVD